MIKLSAYHPTFTATSHLQEFANPLFCKFNLNYFQYIKIFKDGSMACASNNPAWQQFCHDHYWAGNKPVAFSSPPKSECLDPEKYCFLWDPNLPAEPVGFGREFDLNNGITFVERTAEYYTMMGFAAPSTNKSVVNTYLNNIAFFLQFIEKFKQNQQDLINILDSNRIIVPVPQQDENLTQMLSQKSGNERYLITYDNIRSYITKSEKKCVKLLAEGYTYKQIAQQLCISPRTVETYLNRVKQRLGLSERRELINLIQNPTFA